MEFLRKLTYALLGYFGAIKYVQPELRDALFFPQDNRENFKQIIAKRSDLVQFSRGRLAPSLIGTYQYAGLVLGLATSGGDAGYYKAYNSANTDGSQVAVGVLSEDANVQAGPGALSPPPGAGSGTSVASGPLGFGSEIIIIRATANLFQSLLIGLDSNAISNLGARSYVEGGQTILYIP
jgi:hypothetical protein